MVADAGGEGAIPLKRALALLFGALAAGAALFAIAPYSMDFGLAKPTKGKEVLGERAREIAERFGYGGPEERLLRPGPVLPTGRFRRMIRRTKSLRGTTSRRQNTRSRTLTGARYPWAERNGLLVSPTHFRFPSRERANPKLVSTDVARGRGGAIQPGKPDASMCTRRS
jgi:hypothetical protein